MSWAGRRLEMCAVYVYLYLTDCVCVPSYLSIRPCVYNPHLCRVPFLAGAITPQMVAFTLCQGLQTG